MRTRLLAVLLLAACGGEGAADGTASEVPTGISPGPGVYPFQGVWAGADQDCALPPGTSEATPTIITQATLMGPGHACDVLAVEEQGADAAYIVTLSCGAGEPPQGETALYAVRGDTLTVGPEDGAGATLRRCEPSDAGE